MKIAYVLRYFPALTETFVLHEMQELRRLGHQVVVVSMGERADSTLVTNAGDIPVIRMPRGLRRALLLGAWWRDCLSGAGLRPNVYRLRTRWVAARLQAWGAERLHVHFAGEAALWSRDLADAMEVPYTVTVHAVDLFKPTRGLRGVLDAAQTVVTVCDHHAAYLVERYEIEATVVRMGVLRVAKSAVTHSERDRLRVISIGRFVPKKGLDLLVGVVTSLNDEVELHLVGDAPPSLEGSNVTVGPLPHSQVREALRAADVFVLPCRVAPDGDRDGIPVALMEAMAEGLPVVSTRVAGIPELVDDSVGWLLGADDVEGLRRALREAMDTTTRSQRGLAAWTKIAKQDWTVARQVREMLIVWRVSDA